MQRYDVTGDVPKTGPVKHVIKAEDPIDAWEKFQRAYPDRKCRRIEVRESHKAPLQTKKAA